MLTDRLFAVPSSHVPEMLAGEFETRIGGDRRQPSSRAGGGGGGGGGRFLDQQFKARLVLRQPALLVGCLDYHVIASGRQRRRPAARFQLPSAEVSAGLLPRLASMLAAGIATFNDVAVCQSQVPLR